MSQKAIFRISKITRMSGVDTLINSVFVPLLIFVTNPLNFRDPWGLDTVDVSFAFKSSLIGQNVGFTGFNIQLETKATLQKASYPTISSSGNSSNSSGFSNNIDNHTSKPYFINKTQDYYIVIPEHPTDITIDKVDEIIIKPNTGHYDYPIDAVKNIRTGEVRKVSTGSRLTATQDKMGTVNYKVTFLMDQIGILASGAQNALSFIKGKTSYRSKPGLYALGKWPDDIQWWFDDPNHQTLREADDKAKLLQEEIK